MVQRTADNQKKEEEDATIGTEAVIWEVSFLFFPSGKLGWVSDDLQMPLALQ